MVFHYRDCARLANEFLFGNQGYIEQKLEVHCFVPLARSICTLSVIDMSATRGALSAPRLSMSSSSL